MRKFDLFYEKAEEKLELLYDKYIDTDKVKHFNKSERRILMVMFFSLAFISSIIFYFTGSLFLIIPQIIIDLYIGYSFFVIIRDHIFDKSYGYVNTLPLFLIACFSSMVCAKIFPYRGDDLMIKRREKLARLKRL